MPLIKDFQVALRQLRKSPAFTLVVLATLGLCIGVNTAIYSVLDAVLLRPAPYPEPGRLALLTTEYWHNGQEGTNQAQTGAMYEQVRDGMPSLEMAAYNRGHNGANFVAPGQLEYILQQRVAAGFFHVLGVAPQYGREFLPSEDVAGGPAVAVLSYEFWQRAFHGDTAALGRAFTLRGEPFTVVGIMPRGFRSDAAADVWTPLRPSRTGEGRGSNYAVVARLKDGVTWTQANEQLRALSRGIVEGTNLPRGTTYEERVVPFQSGLTGGMRSELLLTWGAVLAVLLIGCVNIAGLLVVRSAARSREIATRMALGAGRAVIIRQLLVESLLLGLGGCALGVAVGAATVSWLKQLGAKDFELWHPIVIDGRVLFMMMVLAGVTSLIFGLIPALATSRLDIRSVLMEGGRGVAGGRRPWPRQVLVVCEVALTLMLLVGAGLLVRTLDYVNGLNPGFDPHHVITAQASLQDARYESAAAVNLLYQRSLERIRLIPGVQSAAVALTLPYERPLNTGFRLLDGSDPNGHPIEMVYSTPGYFETLRIPLASGRVYRDSDTAGSAPVVVVSQSFATKYLHGRDPLGHHLDLGDKQPAEIIGVVGDVQQHSGLGVAGPVSIEPTIYVPSSQVSSGTFRQVHTWFPPKWVVRASGPTGTLTAQMQSAVAGVDPQLPMAKFQTIDDLQAKITSGQRYDAALFSILAGLALVLAAIGLYGLISQSIAQRTQELGIRLALGATAGQAMGNAIRPGLLLACAGVAVGFLLSRLAVGLLEHLLFGVKTTDPLTYVTTGGILLLVTALASLLPALRILRIDPVRILKSE